MHVSDTYTRFYNKIKKSVFLKSVITLASGTIIGQGINTLGMPIISRLYSTVEMGDYSLITANANVIAAVACLGMMTAIMLPKEDEEAELLIYVISKASVIITTIFVVAFKIIQPYWMFFHPEKESYIVGLVILWAYVISTTISSACYGYANRRKQYSVMFWNPVIAGVINIVLGIVFGIFSLGFAGYALAHIISSMVNILHLLVFANPYKMVKRDKNKILKLVREYKRFPLYQMPANLISNLSNQLPLQMMEMVYTSSATGMYSMALRVLSIPSTFLAVPINRVYYQEAAQRYNRGESIGNFSYKIIKANIKIAMIPIGIIIVFGRPLFSFILGTQWREAGKYASIMGIYQLMLFCSNCLSGNFVIIRRNNWNLFSSAAIVLIELVLAFFLITNPAIQLSSFLLILCTVLTLHLVIVLGVFLVFTGVKIREYIRFVLLYICVPYIVTYMLNFYILR